MIGRGLCWFVGIKDGVLSVPPGKMHIKLRANNSDMTEIMVRCL